MGATTSTTAGNTQFTFPLKLEVDEMLSKARFLKSHRCHDETGYYVVKTYVKPSNFSSNKDYKKELESLKKSPAPHVCPYQLIVETDKTIQGIRQYFHSSLSARLSTLPFLTKIEKKWITYQLLVYLEKAEKWGLFHGDLKCENVMLTSWNWIFVTDHAFAYKPLYLANQNDGGFSYFFDTSTRFHRTCYLAPERFGGTTDTATTEEDQEAKVGDSKAKMDVFSMGCVIAELWLEQDKHLFEYGNLLKYKAGSDEVFQTLNYIQDTNIRQLVQQMIHRDPEQRHGASYYLKNYMGVLFPSYFETLHDAISKILTADPNERVRRISLSLDDLHKLFTDKPFPFLPSQLTPLGTIPASNSPRGAPATKDAASPFATDVPSPFSPVSSPGSVPFASTSLPSKRDIFSLKASLKPLLTEDARLELAVQFPSLTDATDADGVLEALHKQGHLEDPKLEVFIEKCKGAEALLPIAKLLETVHRRDSLFDLPKPRPTAASTSSSRSNPGYSPDQLPDDETRFIDAQGGLMNATLASERLLRQLLHDQEHDRLFRELNVDAYMTKELRALLKSPSIDSAHDASLLAYSQSESHCRQILEECYTRVDQLNSAPPQDGAATTTEDDSIVPPSNYERKELDHRMMVAYEMLSSIYRERGDYRQALAFHVAFLGRAKQWKDEGSLQRGFQQYGLTYHAMGSYDEAIGCYKQSLTFANAIRNKRILIDLYRLLSEAYADKSVLQTATKYHILYEELSAELKSSLEQEPRAPAATFASPGVPRGSINVMQHKLLSTPLKTPRASTGAAPASGGLVSTPKITQRTSSFALATTPSRAELVTSAADLLPSDEPGTLGYVIILDILCTMLPYLTDSNLKLTCLDCFVRIAPFADDEIRLQRLIPCLVSYLDTTRDPSALVRAQAIKTLAYVITLVNEFPIDDAHIFQDYLIPVLTFILKDERESIVHQAFAEALPKLAKCAKKCLDHSQLHKHRQHASTLSASSSAADPGALSSSSISEENKKDSVYENDLKDLRDVFHDIITEWLETHAHSTLIVKRTVLEDIGVLAEFFGPEGTNNHLLQLIFSWLNLGWELKCAVFDNIASVAQIAGPEAIESYIDTYLPIHDESEFVIDSAVNCLASLCESGVFAVQRLREYAMHTSPLLLHPNAWIRFGTCQFLVKIAKQLTEVEVQAFIIPHIRRFLTHDISTVSQATLLQALQSPVSRSAYEKAMTQLNLAPVTQPSDVALSTGNLTAERMSSSGGAANHDSSTSRRLNMLAMDSIADFVVIERPSQAPTTSAKPSNAASFFNQAAAELADKAMDLNFSLGLAELDLEPQDEEKLFSMKEYVKEARKARIENGKKSNITADSWAKEYTRLSAETTVHDISQYIAPPPTPTQVTTTETSTPEEPTELWKAMFGGNPPDGPAGRVSSPAPQKVTSDDEAPKVTLVPPPGSGELSPDSHSASAPSSTGSLREASAFAAATGSRDAFNLGSIRVNKTTAPLTTNWMPQGILVATLSEHLEAVTQLQVSKDGAFFASGSHDGKVKIWDSAQFEHNGALRSAATYHGLGSAVTSIAICQDSHSVAASSIQGSIHVFRVDGTQQKDARNPYSTSLVRRLDQNDGVILKIEHFDQGSESLLVYATDRGQIRAWDLRTQKEPWIISNSPHLGLISSLLVDPNRNWLAVGTDAGNFTCWDLRFRVPLLHWGLPGADGLTGIHALAADPLQNGCFWASSGPGIVAHWNLETKQCKRILRVAPRESGPKANPVDWDSVLVPKDNGSEAGDDFRIADLQKPLTESARSLEAHLNTIRTVTVSPNGNFVLTGGADRKLRFWSLDAPTKSSIISGKDPKEDIAYSAVDTPSKKTSIIEEIRSPVRDGPFASAVQQPPSGAHSDTILDVKLLEMHSGKKVMAVSASRDGVIKVWK